MGHVGAVFTATQTRRSALADRPAHRQLKRRLLMGKLTYWLSDLTSDNSSCPSCWKLFGGGCRGYCPQSLRFDHDLVG